MSTVVRWIFGSGFPLPNSGYPQKGGDPAAGSPTATLLRLSPSHRSYRRRLPPEGWVSDFGHYQLPWLDGRCVQGSGTHSPERS